jgi:deazaflavin-dependent oxidoreductase (nitroreductase family)
VGLLRFVTEGSGLGSEPFCYLTTTGRISGRSHRIEIWFALHDDAVYLLSGGREDADWVRNILVSPQVVLEIADVKRLTHARMVEPGTDEDALARLLMLEKYDGPGENLREWARMSFPFAIAWEPAA